MTRRRSLLLALALALLPSAGLAASAVFNGDPVDPLSGQPYEIQPGRALVQPGPDGQLGTGDDVVNPALVGDVDLVVRAGTLDAGAALPAPRLAGGRAALPQGIAGPANAGGSEIPFTVFVSDGSGAAAGTLLAAADLDGIPVVVAAFADLDGDGYIGLTTGDRSGASDLHLELRELEPVGRAAALLSGGVARGHIAVRAGRPASRGGLIVALTAQALTGPFDAAFFDGAIPRGPAIATALPFLPQRDLNRMIRDRAVPAGSDTTVQQLVQFAAVPAPDAYALRLDGSVPSIDAAIVASQPAVRVSFRDGGALKDMGAPVARAVIGQSAPGSLARWRLVPVDRFENPADPPAGFAVDLSADASLRLLGQRRRGRGQPIAVRSASGVRVVGRVAPGVASGSSGALRVERDGIVIASLPYLVDSRADCPRADVTVPSAKAPTIQAAVAGAADTNHDGRLVIRVRAGLYRERVVIDRPLELMGSGNDATIMQGDGSGSVVSASVSGVIVRGLTVTGGQTGIALAGGARLIDSRAWRNRGAGVVLGGAGAEMWQSAAEANGGAGVSFAAAGASCAASRLAGNGGPGVDVPGAANAAIVDNLLLDNAGGVLVTGAPGVLVADNRSVLNLGSGVELLEAEDGTVTGNLCAGNDEDGLSMERADGALIARNTFDDNNGYGLFVRRSAADFAAAAGTQAPPGDNSAGGNRKGDVFVRQD